ncbi:hypothetical protein PIB30_008489 [Stylosanthes scabra]|uniref:Putative plant transposon protein domain-containing protein n=1 Tax=Stylosanthes scabra TaxID=79078 RepID=A0ABU6Y1H3_9FABA|nr:hypothetical protein [Stylosanthes scabra]
MASKGKGTASTSTPSRVRNTKNSSRGRGDTFPADRFHAQIHYDRWKTLEHRGYTHERIIRFPDKDLDFFHDRVEELGWGFMYNALVPINVTMVPEFCANFSSPEQETPGVDDAFVGATKAREANNLDMEMVFRVIRREGTSWTDNPAVNTIPKTLDNAIMSTHASAWHKLIMANIDPKTHGTTFDIHHALLIYVLMTEWVVNIPRIMRDILLTRPMKHSHNLVPYPVFISRLANQHQVLEYARDEFYTMHAAEMYCPYGDWKGEQPRMRRGRVAEQQPLPIAFAVPSTSAQYSLEPFLHDVMRRLDRQERLLRRQSRQIANTQIMIRQAFPGTYFTRLERISSDDSSESTEAEL